MISPYIRDTILGEMMTNNKINFITISETFHTQADKASDWDYEGFVKLPELTCQKCGESFTHNAAFEKHAFSHVGYRPYACIICERAYFAKRNLLAHVRAIHMTGTKRSEQEGKEDETTHEVSHQTDVDRLEHQTDGSGTHTPYLLEKGKEFSPSVSDGETGFCMHRLTIGH